MNKPKKEPVPAAQKKTTRQTIEDLLDDHWCTFEELRREIGGSPRDVETELDHLAKSLKRRNLKIEIQPAECLDCEHKFQPRRDKPFHAPQRCPECKSEHVADPKFHIAQ